MTQLPPKALPDIARDVPARTFYPLAQVGMSSIQVPIRLRLGNGETSLSMGTADAFVNLIKPEARGIHMSRLYLASSQALAENPCTFPLLTKILDDFLASHAGLSDSAFLRVQFPYPMVRPALVSGFHGWRSYPMSMRVSHEHGQRQWEVNLRLTYSSTCPCSGALARQLVAEQFSQRFGQNTQIEANAVAQWLRSEEGMVATPHSQRSDADLILRLRDPHREWDLEGVIERVEQALSTPVQTAVKRADEQEFARRNGTRLMFTEDAARTIVEALQAETAYADFALRVSHRESLHPHDAVAMAVKGVTDGLTAQAFLGFSL